MKTATPALLDGVRAVLFDCDGVLWSGTHVTPGAVEVVEMLRRRGIHIRFVTNNASVCRDRTLTTKLHPKGFVSARPEEVFNSGFATAEFLRKQGEDGLFRRNVFIVGNDGLHAEVRKALAPGCFTYGMELNLDVPAGHVPGGINPGAPYDMQLAVKATTEKILPPPLSNPSMGPVSLRDLDVGAVVCAFDFSTTNTKMAMASLCLQRAATPEDCMFVATNPDPSLTLQDAEGKTWHMPGTGSNIKLLEIASGRAPDIVCGKPAQGMMEMIQLSLGDIHPSECLMVGDRLTTDIAFGNAASCQTMLVLTGCETVEHCEETGIIPTYVAQSVADLLE